MSAPTIGPRSDRERLELAAEELAALQLPCALCRAPSAQGVAGFAPTTPDLRRLVGAPPGRLRVCLFPICDDCAEHATLEDRERAALRFVHVRTQRKRARWQ